LTELFQHDNIVQSLKCFYLGKMYSKASLTRQWYLFRADKRP